MGIGLAAASRTIYRRSTGKSFRCWRAAKESQDHERMMSYAVGCSSGGKVCRKEGLCLKERNARIPTVLATPKINIAACSAKRWKRFRILNASVAIRLARGRLTRLRLKDIGHLMGCD